MLLLVGIPGSGKSTFAKILQKAKPWKYVIINQDLLKTRKKCIDAVRRTLSENKVPIIDRCNFNVEQRKHFVDMARNEFQVPVDCVVFSYSKDVCIRRCENRRGHQTMSQGKARMVVSMMMSRFSPPLQNGADGETFRTLRNVTNIQMANDIVLEYLNDT